VNGSPLSILTTAPPALPRALIHELRNHLGQIIGYSELLLEQAQKRGQSSFVPDLQTTHTAGRKMLALLDDHTGSIYAFDTSPGPGISPRANGVPVEQEPLPDALPETTATADISSTATLGSVLVVDDIEANRDVLSRRLREQGYTVTAVKDGKLALARLREDAFDLVLLDIMMPEMDGYEVLRILKADEALRHIPVIMISALGEQDSAVRCIEMGAEDYLSKPFNPVLLKARIGACLEKKRLHDREAHLYAQLQESYQRLQQLEKRRDDLTHMIVHDLRTPLNAMMMGIQELEFAGELNEGQQEMMEITRRGGQTLVAIINDLLDISQMESGALRLERREVMATDLIDDAMKQVTALATAKSVTLVLNPDPDLPGLIGDEAKLIRILVNLLSNAIKFTPASGTVTVAARLDHDGPSLQFSISDTGEGIPAEAFGRIFEKFGQVESRHGGRSMSTGLGLTFCKLAVEAHGGQIGVESIPGQGSTFRFTLPLPQAPQAAS
jgi:two-component system sensor histidine kinase/response regulator